MCADRGSGSEPHILAGRHWSGTYVPGATIAGNTERFKNGKSQAETLPAPHFDPPLA